MGLKHTLNHFLSNVVSALGNAFKAKSLPSHFNGMWVRLSPKSWTALHQEYELYMAQVLQADLRPGGVFLDVGAHFGLWSVYAANIVGKKETYSRSNLRQPSRF